jgi:hypothetical protein
MERPTRFSNGVNLVMMVTRILVLKVRLYLMDTEMVSTGHDACCDAGHRHDRLLLATRLVSFVARRHFAISYAHSQLKQTLE